MPIQILQISDDHILIPNAQSTKLIKSLENRREILNEEIMKRKIPREKYKKNLKTEGTANT